MMIALTIAFSALSIAISTTTIVLEIRRGRRRRTPSHRWNPR